MTDECSHHRASHKRLLCSYNVSPSIRSVIWELMAVMCGHTDDPESFIKLLVSCSVTCKNLQNSVVAVMHQVKNQGDNHIICCLIYLQL